MGSRPVKFLRVVLRMGVFESGSEKTTKRHLMTDLRVDWCSS